VSAVRAAVLTEFGKPLEIREYPEASNLAPGEALVRVEMAGICGTDVHLWLGQLAIPLPVILGHETVGRIERIGTPSPDATAEVTAFQSRDSMERSAAGLPKDWRGQPLSVGDRVCWASSIACGECFYCRVKNQPTRCLTRKAYGISYNADEAPHLRGGYAQKILLRAGTAIFRLPENLETEAVVGAGCALTTAIHGIERAPIVWGDTVVIQGTGPVGLASLAVAREAGAGRIIVTGGPPHRLALAREFGADVVIDVDSVKDLDSRRKQVLQETSGYGADVVIECVGHPDAVNEGIEYCRDGGKFLVLGQYANAGNISFNPHTITRKQLQVIGSWGFEPRHVDRALSLLERSEWKHRFARQITHRFPLEQANEALQTTREWQSGKTVIVP
jgi:threonine dehydrogenase-like Zn-dependent dehydrogenase